MKKRDYRKEAMEMSKNHWEMDVSASVFPKANKKDPLDNWIAKPGKEWPRPYEKVNECDY